MDFLKLCIASLLLCMPSQDWILSATCVNKTKGPSPLSGERYLAPNGKPSNDGSGESMSRGQSTTIFEGLGKVHIEMTLDGFEIKPWLAQAHASFSVVYQFEIGEDGHPMHIFMLAGEKFIDGKAASEGLAKWAFVGLKKGKKYVLVVNWESMKGYASMSLLSDQMSLSVRLQKDRPVP